MFILLGLRMISPILSYAELLRLSKSQTLLVYISRRGNADMQGEEVHWYSSHRAIAELAYVICLWVLQLAMPQGEQ